MISRKRKNSFELCRFSKWYKTYVRQERDKRFLKIFPKGARVQGQTQDPWEIYLTTCTDAETCGDTECPITMDKFQESEVDFLPGAKLMKTSPHLCVGKLPCGHHVAVVPLMYTMLVLGVRCPMCRSGPNWTMQSNCIPPHLRSKMCARVCRIKKQEREDLDAASRDTAMRLVSEMVANDPHADIGMLNMDMAQANISVFLSVYMYAQRSLSSNLVYSTRSTTTPSQNSRNVLHVTYPMGTEDNFVFFLSPEHVSNLSRSLDDMNVQFIRLTVHAGDSSRSEPLLLCSTGVFQISEIMPGNAAIIGASHYVIRVGDSDDVFHLDRYDSSHIPAYKNVINCYHI